MSESFATYCCLLLTSKSVIKAPLKCLTDPHRLFRETVPSFRAVRLIVPLFTIPRSSDGVLLNYWHWHWQLGLEWRHVSTRDCGRPLPPRFCPRLDDARGRCKGRSPPVVPGQGGVVLSSSDSLFWRPGLSRKNNEAHSKLVWEWWADATNTQAWLLDFGWAASTSNPG